MPRVLTILASALAAVLVAALVPLGAAVPAGATAATAAPAAADDFQCAPGPYVLRAEAFFGDPGSRYGDISCVILRAINGAPKGSLIQGVTWSFDSATIARALAAADNRGVRVKMLVAKQAEPGIRKYLRAQLNGKGSKLVVSNGAARGNPALGKGAMHQKSWTFSSTYGKRFVSIITSANATTAASDWQYNDGYQFVGYRPVHRTLKRVFAQQVKRRDQRAPFIQENLTPNTALTFNPWNSPSMADPVVGRINGLPQDRLVIRIANASWSGDRGLAIARALVAKKRAGAKVRVVVGGIGPQVKAVLVRGGIPVKLLKRSDEDYLHSKSMIARYGTGSAKKARLWTGSENWGDAPRAADEVVVKVSNAAAVTAWQGYFDHLWSLGTRLR
ncbi:MULTISPECIES: phospholipase D-like domain-containing protein [unclassified Nocardioides]|uniref:phospholipase D-like domain-containing protein n=1 Tax=unclassified Nocardioides TaxID=2615069 RepID=UPI003014B4F2